MGGTGVIDNFLGVFTSYIDSGFGLLGGEVAFIATTLIVIDVTLAALFWSWGADDDIIARLVKKTLFVGVFAYLIGNWNNLAQIIFDSFAGLGLKGSGTSFSAADLLRPGKVAQTGLDAGHRARFGKFDEGRFDHAIARGEFRKQPNQCRSPAAEQGVGGFDVGKTDLVGVGKAGQHAFGGRQCGVAPEQRLARLQALCEIGVVRGVRRGHGFRPGWAKLDYRSGESPVAAGSDG